MWQFFILTFGIAIYDLYEIKKQNNRKEMKVYLTLFIILIVYSILYYANNPFMFDFYSVFSKIF